MTEAASNTLEISVTELSGAIKRTMEDAFGFVRVRGELSGYRGPHSSGHVYFALKDDRAKIEAVIWKGVFGRLKFRPEEGMEVVATGKVSTFPGSSKYQLVIETMEPAGVGALLAQLEERRRRLTAEGLFAAERKKPLPYIPRLIGVVTSPTGAVIRDIIHRLAERFPRHVLVWPVRVQGETSAAEVAAAIRGFNALPADGPIARPDLLIVARGGGSLEDLWGFNEEAVVRAAAESRIPLISAVGHETDTTLIDFAADRRAPTPTGAAEMAVPVRAELLATTADRAGRLAAGSLRLLERRRGDLRGLARALPGAEAILALPSQRLDTAAGRLAPSLKTGVDKRRIALAEVSRRLAAQSPQARMGRLGERLEGLEGRLRRALATSRTQRAERFGVLVRRLGQALVSRTALERATLVRRNDRLASAAARLLPALQTSLAGRRDRIEAQDRLLNSLGHRAVLGRGFALVRDAAGTPLHSARIPGGTPVEIEFADGRVRAVTGEGSSRTAPKPRPKDGGQESLF